MQSVSARGSELSLSRRVFALLIALCLICTSAAPAALAAPPNPAACTAQDVATDSFGGTRPSSADNRLSAAFDALSGSSDVPVARAARMWLTAATASRCGIDPACWLRCPAHGPPKSIRFCSFLI